MILSAPLVDVSRACTSRFTLCVASHQIAPWVSICEKRREQLRQLLSHCASLRTSLSMYVSTRENEQLRKLDTPCAFLSVPTWGHLETENALCVALDPMWAITAASQAGCAMCVASTPMRAVTTASQAEYAMCVASCPHRGHTNNSTARHAMSVASVPMRAITAPQKEEARAVSALCVVSHTNDPCVFPSGKNMVFNALHAARKRGERNGEPGLRW